MESWVKNNIFSFKKMDGVAYLVFYIFIPVTITYASLATFPEDDIAGIYCYVTILVSALNCIYDSANRWITGEKSFKNTKLFLMMSSATVIVVYCIIVIFNAFVKGSLAVRLDCCLYIYIIVVIVALTDAVSCFAIDMAWMACVKSSELEEGIK